jgi:hypothetical protein
MDNEDGMEALPVAKSVHSLFTLLAPTLTQLVIEMPLADISYNPRLDPP